MHQQQFCRNQLEQLNKLQINNQILIIIYIGFSNKLFQSQKMLKQNNLIYQIREQNPKTIFKLEKPLLHHSFTSDFSGQGSQIFQLMLYPNFIIIQHSINHQKYLLEFNFEVKFEMNLRKNNKNNETTNTLNFFKKNCAELKFYQQNDQVIDLWKIHLLRKINRIGFSKIFKSTIKIGRGSFASVFLAINLQQNKRVAIKSYSKKVIQNDSSKRLSLINEINILREISHKNLNQFYGVYESDQNIYVVLELIDGGQLAYKFQSKYKFTSSEIKSIIKGILEGLKHIHEKNIMHRDIKPENILFRLKSKQTEVVIVDFGLASFSNTKNYLYYRCGTPGYIAPQILRNTNKKKKIDPICDIFSAGIIFHLLLTGRSVFNNKNYQDILEENYKCQFDLESSIYSHFTIATVDLLKKMLDVNPNTRISAEEAVDHPFFKQMQIQRSKYKLNINSLKQVTDEYSEYSEEEESQIQYEFNTRYNDRKNSVMAQRPTSKYQSPQKKRFYDIIKIK